MLDLDGNTLSKRSGTGSFSRLSVMNTITAYLTEHGFLSKYTATGKKGYNYYYWPDNKTRHPIYFNRLKRNGRHAQEKPGEARDHSSGL